MGDEQQELLDVAELPILVCLLYWSFTMLLCRALRKNTSKFLSKRGSTSLLVNDLLQDFLCTFQGVSCAMEKSFITRYYGFGYYLCASFFLCLVSLLSFGKNSGNPCTTWRRYLQGQNSRQFASLKIVCQMIGGLCAHHYAHYWWSFSATREHSKRFNMITLCRSDLQVPVLIGFLIELGATVCECVSSRLTLPKSLLSSSGGPLLQRLMEMGKIVFSLFLLWAGIGYTGLYTNPANASAQTMGCSGCSNLEHVLVYWCAPFLGVWIGLNLPPHRSSVLEASTDVSRGDESSKAVDSPSPPSSASLSPSCPAIGDESGGLRRRRVEDSE